MIAIIHSLVRTFWYILTLPLTVSLNKSFEFLLQKLHCLSLKTISILRFKIVIDTGAPQSCISILNFKETFKPLPLSRMFSFGKTPTLEYGYIRLNVNLALPKGLSWKFIVIGILMNIIGNDFLSYFHLFVDVRRKRLLSSNIMTHLQC